jgi:hypothetical protein
MDETVFGDFNSTIERMSQPKAPEKMTLQEIRDAYAVILKSYNELFPLYVEARKSSGEMEEGAEKSGKKNEDRFYETFMVKAKKIVPKLKEAADQSGSVQIWRKGESLDNLSEGLQERIERAIRLGF